MDIFDQVINDRYAIYNGDCVPLMAKLPKNSVHLSLYSPPFAGLYIYSSNDRDMSNCRSYETFMENYAFCVKEIERVTLPGRLSGVHCMDVPEGTDKGLIDFPGDIIRLHKSLGFYYVGRYHVWKEPLGVRNRTMAKGLAHKTVVTDSSLCDVASADYLLMFRKHGENTIPISHEQGLSTYAGSRSIPQELLKYRDMKVIPRENKLSHWIWRQYASSFWDDVRIERVLPYKECREPDDEKHCHPLQLDVIERCLTLWSNPGETMLTPYMGVGSEVYGAVINGRRAIGMELKPAYFKQSVKNLAHASQDRTQESSLFDLLETNLEPSLSEDMD